MKEKILRALKEKWEKGQGVVVDCKVGYSQGNAHYWVGGAEYYYTPLHLEGETKIKVSQEYAWGTNWTTREELGIMGVEEAAEALISVAMTFGGHLPKVEEIENGRVDRSQWERYDEEEF